MTQKLIALMSQLGYWWDEARYDSAGVQSNRTFVAETERVLGMHNPVRRFGGPATKPVPFNKYKAEGVNYLRQLFLRAGAGRRTRIVAISPTNTELIRQLRAYIIDKKEDDHGPDALTAGIQPIATRHRAMTEEAAA